VAKYEKGEVAGAVPPEQPVDIAMAIKALDDMNTESFNNDEANHTGKMQDNVIM